VTAAPGPGPAVTAAPYAALTMVRDGPGYVLGRRGGTDFVAVPEIGGQVIQRLQGGAGLRECERRAAEAAGEPVDVTGFLDGLAQAGLLPAGRAASGGTAEPGTAEPGTAEPGAGADEPPAVTPRQAATGRVMFGRAGLAIQAVLAVTAAVVLLAVPGARPGPGDGVATGVPLASLLLLGALATVLRLAHQGAHVLAVARRAVGWGGPAGRAVLAAAGRRQTRWARVFLGLYLPGAAATGWYFAAFAVPATASIVRAGGHALAAGPWSMAGAAAVLALALTAGSAAFVLAGQAGRRPAAGTAMTDATEPAGG
jgi:hypothetical protein